MKPKTKIQKEVARLSANLRPISATQIDWAYRHCVEHIGYRTKKGNITCSDCGHEWHSDSGLCDTLEGCTCPKCHAELKVQDTRRRIYKETQNFSVITTCKGYQVIRVAQVRCESRKGEPMLLLPRGCAALDFTRREGYGHGVAPWLPFLLLRCVGIRQRYGGKTAQQPIR